METRRRAIIESVTTAAVAYVVAAVTEAGVIRTLRPTEWELAWVSDVVLSVALGVAVYLWRHLRATRLELAARERAELVLHTQLTIAADIQRRLLPDLPRPGNGVEWAARLETAGKIGGDLYDIVEVGPEQWLALVVDVSGKGIPAAMALGSLHSTFRALARAHDRPAHILTRLSAQLYDEWHGEPYVTGIVVRLDARQRVLTYANAGHPAGIVTGPTGVRLLDAMGPPAALLPRTTYDERDMAVDGGDACILVSDGVTEALESEPGRPLDQIVAIAGHHAGSAESVCRAVMERALRAVGPPGVPEWHDDRTVLVLTIHENGPAAAIHAA